MKNSTAERDTRELDELVGALGLSKAERKAVFDLLADVDGIATVLLERRHPRIQGMRMGLVMSALFAALLKLNELAIAEAKRKCGA